MGPRSGLSKLLQVGVIPRFSIHPNSPSYCNNISGALNFPSLEPKRAAVADLVAAAGYPNDTAVQDTVLNAINYYGATAVRSWQKSGDSQNEFFTQLNDTHWQDTSLEAAEQYRSWNYQVCTEWGYFQTGNTPPDIKPLISRTLDLEYTSYFCHAGYNITGPPDLSQVNKYGNYSIEYPRLAIIGGNADPWKPATPLARGPDARVSTTEKPWLQIAHGVHHWEENGIFPNETTPELPPPQVVYAQQFLKNFVIDWLKGEIYLDMTDPTQQLTVRRVSQSAVGVVVLETRTYSSAYEVTTPIIDYTVIPII